MPRKPSQRNAEQAYHRRAKAAGMRMFTVRLSLDEIQDLEKLCALTGVTKTQKIKDWITIHKARIQHPPEVSVSVIMEAVISATGKGLEHPDVDQIHRVVCSYFGIPSKPS